MTDLLTEIQQYLHDTGMTKTMFGRTVFKNKNFVGDLEEGRKCGDIVTQRVRDFMAANPDWKPKPKKKGRPRNSPHPNQYRVIKTEKDANLIVIDRTPCFNCGVRADVGCHHQPKSTPERLI